jgi:hypothetical protein
MSPASRHLEVSAQLDRLAESGALDPLAWALTGVLLSAAQRLAPEAMTPAEAAWILAGRADPSLRPPAATDSADHRRPLGAGVRPMQHEAASAFSGRQRGFEEDDHDGCTTATTDV